MRPGHKQRRTNKCTPLHNKQWRQATKKRAIKNKIRYEFDPLGKVINLSKHSFSSYTFKLLNKNLNFVPTPKKYIKRQLNTDTEDFFRFIKLRAHLRISPQSRTYIKKTFHSK